MCLRVSCISNSDDISMTHTSAARPLSNFIGRLTCLLLFYKNISQLLPDRVLFTFCDIKLTISRHLVGWLFVCASFHSFVNMIRFLLQLLKDLLHLPPSLGNQSPFPSSDTKMCCRLHLAGSLIHLVHYLNCLSSKRSHNAHSSIHLLA